MTRDYRQARAHFERSAVRAVRELGNERAAQRFLGAIDALIEAYFAVSGPGGEGAIELALDNTKQERAA